MDAVDRHVKQQIGQGVGRAYGFRTPDDTAHDPELCVCCQRVRPVEGSDRCEECGAFTASLTGAA